MTATFSPLDASSETFDRLLSERPVLWVGAGTSIAASYPSTRDLIDAMRERSLGAIPADLTFTEVADRFVANNTAAELADLLHDLIGQSHVPTGTLRAIARHAAAGHFAAIITTNYDNLLERVLDDASVPYLPQALEKNFELKDDGQLRLLKIHGSKEDWRETILSGNSYDAFTRRYKMLAGQLNLLLTQRRILFVGCSLKDPRILDWIDGLKVAERERLKVWTPILPEKAWHEALDEPWNGGQAK